MMFFLPARRCREPSTSFDLFLRRLTGVHLNITVIEYEDEYVLPCIVLVVVLVLGC